MAPKSQRGREGAAVRVDCEECGQPLPPVTHTGGYPRRFCARACRDKFNAGKRRQAQRGPGSDVSVLAPRRKRRPLAEVSNDAGWRLRADVERIERIFADDRFAQNEEQVTAQLHGHLAYAAEVCQGLISRINHLTGE